MALVFRTWASPSLGIRTTMKSHPLLPIWTLVVPIAAWFLLAGNLFTPGALYTLLLGAGLLGCVLVAVHHAASKKAPEAPFCRGVQIPVDDSINRRLEASHIVQANRALAIPLTEKIHPLGKRGRQFNTRRQRALKAVVTLEIQLGTTVQLQL